MQHGGVLLYVNNKIVVDISDNYNDDQCGAVICVSKLSKLIICNIYRPPAASPDSFSSLLNFINSFLSLHNPLNKLHVAVFGDFNLPKFCWSHSGRLVSTFPNEPSYILFHEFLETNFLSQYVNQNTRKNNIIGSISNF